jgi:hypothetical protein
MVKTAIEVMFGTVVVDGVVAPVLKMYTGPGDRETRCSALMEALEVWSDSMRKIGCPFLEIGDEDVEVFLGSDAQCVRGTDASVFCIGGRR